jgi:transketolase C-terminal domain/subunit
MGAAGALEAADALEWAGDWAAALYVPTLKPFDAEAVAAFVDGAAEDEATAALDSGEEE